MKKIALINASPKQKESASSTIVGLMHDFLKNADSNKFQVFEYEIHKAGLDETSEFLKADILVFAFPLYVDGIPSHLLQCLCEIEQIRKELYVNQNDRKQRVYAVVNCGFYEGKQNQNALLMMENWCEKANFIWSGGIGIGGGGMLAQMQFKEDGKGQMYQAYQALREIVAHIKDETKIADQFTTPDFPRWIYILGAQFGWRQMAKANGLKRRDLNKKRIPSKK